ncbi:MULTISPECIES: copper homeostasis protein CutC [unclassified Sphingomonas]|jgi:copper homeostasis protein|nr:MULTISPECIES: copper homeostasis protein CutC [unclassified Sphingomonas]
MNTLLEICVDDAAGIDAAVAGGADRLELCASLELGGLTPSAALVERAVATGCPVHMMIRPTSGDFVLDGAAIALMQEEIRLGAWRGIVGVVVGATRPEGGLDYDALARFREAARDMRIVLHRAIDLVADPVEAVRRVAVLGYDKILSSGGAPRAIDGATTLAAMVEAAGKNLSIVAGSGVTSDNAAWLLDHTGVREIHASASCAGPAPHPDAIGFGFAREPRNRTDARRVRALRDAIAAWESGRQTAQFHDAPPKA